MGRLLTLAALVGALVVFGFSAFADQHLTSGNTGLGSTTISGGVTVGSTSGGQTQKPARLDHRIWFFAFFDWFRFSDWEQ